MKQVYLLLFTALFASSVSAGCAFRELHVEKIEKRCAELKDKEKKECEKELKKEKKEYKKLCAGSPKQSKSDKAEEKACDKLGKLMKKLTSLHKKAEDKKPIEELQSAINDSMNKQTCANDIKKHKAEFKKVKSGKKDSKKANKKASKENKKKCKKLGAEFDKATSDCKVKEGCNPIGDGAFTFAPSSSLDKNCFVKNKKRMRCEDKGRSWDEDKGKCAKATASEKAKIKKAKLSDKQRKKCKKLLKKAQKKKKGSEKVPQNLLDKLIKKGCVKAEKGA